MFNIFKAKPLLTDEDAKWIFNTFDWALAHFDSEEFFQRTQLIEPSDKFFPGNVDSHQAVANTVFGATLKYTGLSHWPMQLVHPAAFASLPPAFLNLDFSAGVKRNSADSTLLPFHSEHPLTITYNLNQTLKPEDLSASFAHYIAQHLVAQTQITPLGGKQLFAPATEILAVFMGFGILMSNSAYTFRGGCGSCYNAAANRHACLSEDKMVFALALFCRLKGINPDIASKHLKKYLRSSLKRALQQIDDAKEQISPLMARPELISID
ncbi:hypothetical protein CW745_15050 [Psychromonas sp. psych-6C06]|uniref:hypothetical protein n=1 Tax=Psychromonas sp. psych-6C06 TaxID=2058089 RepID=UPI000C340F28|nr:hypothetical protein [Psychromonas sp. psych-6C06]PKF60383.1 hypothetical protein CW745_15050 [Psychromonas sp. psych-6C06]